MKLIVIFALLMMGCQLTQTKVEQQIQLDEKYSDWVKIDTRSPQKYYLAHYPGSVLFQASDFPPSEGIEKIAKRFSLMGIHPNKNILIMTDGNQGQGDEFYLQYILSKLNFLKTQKIHVSQLRLQNLRGEIPLAENAEMWPVPNVEIVRSRKEIKENTPCVQMKSVQWNQLIDQKGNNLLEQITDLQGVVSSCRTEQKICVNGGLDCLKTAKQIAIQVTDINQSAWLYLFLESINKNNQTEILLVQ